MVVWSSATRLPRDPLLLKGLYFSLPLPKVSMGVKPAKMLGTSEDYLGMAGGAEVCEWKWEVGTDRCSVLTGHIVGTRDRALTCE